MSAPIQTLLEMKLVKADEPSLQLRGRRDAFDLHRGLRCHGWTRMLYSCVGDSVHSPASKDRCVSFGLTFSAREPSGTHASSSTQTVPYRLQLRRDYQCKHNADLSQYRVPQLGSEGELSARDEIPSRSLALTLDRFEPFQVGYFWGGMCTLCVVW